MIKIQWLASIWRQNDQNVELRRKTFKTKVNYKSDQNPMTCIDLTSKRSKCWVTSQKFQSKQFKVQTSKLNYKSDQNPMTCIDLSQNDQNVESQNIQKNKGKLKQWSDVKIQWLASIWRQNDQNVELRRKTFKTTTKVNYKSDQNPMTCIDLTSKRSKCWVTSQNIQNKAKLQKWSKSNDLHRFDVKTIKMLSYVAKHSKQSRTTKVSKYKSDQNPMTCIDLTSKRSKCWVTSQNIQNVNYKSDQNPMTCIDLTSKRSKCWVTSQNIQNKGKLQKWSKSNDLHRFDVKTIKMLSYVAKHSKQR